MHIHIFGTFGSRRPAWKGERKRSQVAWRVGLLLLLLLPAARPQAGEVVRVGIYQNDPKLFLDSRGRPSGFFADLLLNMANEQRWQLEWRPCEFEACLEQLEAGTIDMLPDVAWSKARAARFAFGREVALASWAALYTASGEKLYSLKGLHGKRVAVVRGSIYYEALRRQASDLRLDIRFVETASLEEAFRLAGEHKVFAVLVNTFHGWKKAASYNLVESLVILRPTMLFFAVTPARGDELVPPIDYYLAIWKQDRDSVFHQAMERWILPVSRRFPPSRYLWVAVAGAAAIFVLLLLVLLFRKLVRRKTAELEEKQAHFNHLAHHDPLTGLPNRLLFFDRLRHSIRQSRRRGTSLALLFLDLDQFKQINDTYGHGVGDELLKEVAKRLRQAVRETDTIARIGGDEFAVIMESLNEPADVVVGVQHITRAFREPFRTPGHQFSITLSVGISIYPQDGGDAQTLLRNADTAMFRAKAAGRNTYQLYDQEMTRETVERALMEAELREALKSDALEVHFQPQVSLDDGRLVGLEALSRWHHPDLGRVPPERFIALAEEAGLIVELGEQVLKKTCRQFTAWRSQGLEPGIMSVNLSGKQLREPSLLERVSRVLELNHCPSEALEFEITESFVMKQVDESIATMKRLRSMGIGLAIDDFGTGYSSLAYLKLLPISRLKIDRSFIDGIPDDENDRVITRAIIALGKTLGLKVIAEGVENVEQHRFLCEAGCDEAQGNYYGEPMPARDFEMLLRGNQGAGVG